LNKVIKDKTFLQRHTEKIVNHFYVPCAPGRRLEPLVCYSANTQAYIQTHTDVHTQATGEEVRGREEERKRSGEEQRGGEVRPLFSLTAVGKISLFLTGK